MKRLALKNNNNDDDDDNKVKQHKKLSSDLLVNIHEVGDAVRLWLSPTRDSTCRKLF